MMSNKAFYVIRHLNEAITQVDRALKLMGMPHDSLSKERKIYDHLNASIRELNRATIEIEAFEKPMK